MTRSTSTILFLAAIALVAVTSFLLGQQWQLQRVRERHVQAMTDQGHPLGAACATGNDKTVEESLWRTIALAEVNAASLTPHFPSTTGNIIGSSYAMLSSVARHQGLTSYSSELLATAVRLCTKYGGGRCSQEQLIEDTKALLVGMKACKFTW
ncbi:MULTISPECIES: hypothetical protein [unclassified Rhizobacter]|uniref:hypothetical protein n=1 Tax=unclassified Rhizobacter TaxID=2640088 RepID=UPI0006F22F75|nr:MULTISPECIES: hypothetical protein [unclassified Rhizobacter]KQU80390.1 hypothetical protein ASC88_17340 [Rhizobacter sp. Root29]KQW13888.1 hypothetical protein ASC98_17470 [Rhizobacter sp. Root1238]KRB15712.1 hypothetical protein ASE08_26590 [Rhizobacter sp. Root16D2]